MKWTDNERAGLVAFLLFEGAVVFLLAPATAVLGQLGSGAGMQTFSESYLKYAAKEGCWLGTMTIPASLAWMFVRGAGTSRRLPTLIEIGRVLLLECVVIAFFALFYVELGPAFLESAPEWSDVPEFGKTILWMSMWSVVYGAIAWVALSVMRNIGLFGTRAADRSAAELDAPDEGPNR
jgi:hypothetical protein